MSYEQTFDKAFRQEMLEKVARQYGLTPFKKADYEKVDALSTGVLEKLAEGGESSWKDYAKKHRPSMPSRESYSPPPRNSGPRRGAEYNNPARSSWDPTAKRRESGRSFMDTFGEGASKALAGAGVSALAGTSVYAGDRLLKHINRNRSQHQFMNSVMEAKDRNEILAREYETEEGKDKMLSYAQTIQRFAPSVASDPNLLSSILANAIQYDGIDTQTLEHLTNLEKRHTELNSPNVKDFT